MKKERLTIENRLLIEQLLKLNYKLKDIAKVLNKEPSTISREIKRNRISSVKSIECVKTNRYPFICYNCKKKIHCNKTKYYYSYIKAEEKYKSNLTTSRIGIDMTIDEIEYWNDYFKDKIKDKNQPIMHMFNDSNFPKTIQTFYNYINKGYLTNVNNEMLPRAYKFKPRNISNNDNIKPIHKDNIIKIGRKMKDFKEYLESNPNANIVEIDTVIGKFEDVNCILTIYFRDTKLMLMYLIPKYSPSAVVDIFNNFKLKLGIDKFKTIFEVILTDNGWEFSKPHEIECDPKTGEKLISLFYTEPYSSWQKGSIERNHEFIRYVIPKGITFDNLTNKNVIDIMNNINNVQRKSLNFLSPYQLFIIKYGNKIAGKFLLEYIPKDNINLSYKILK